MLRVTSSSVKAFEFFFMASMHMLNLAVVNTFDQYLVDLGWYMDAYMVHVSVHGSWLILHGSL